jgi:multiple sugar transport system substrate-binding protein
MKADNSIHLDEWYKVAWESLTDETGQKYYAVPVTFDCDMLYYNKNMFDAAGLKYPTDNWTYDDMVDAAVKLHKKEGNNVTQYGLTFGWLPWLVFIEANGGTVWDKDQFYTKSTADSPEAIGGIQFMADLYHQYQVVAKPGTAPQVGNLFKAGLAAMMVTGGSWSIQDYNKSITKFKWDVAMPPTNAKSPKKMRPSVGQDNIFIMFKITKDRDATWAFMKELALTEEAQATLATDLETPAMKKVAEGKYKKEVLSPPNGPENGFKVLEAMEKYTRPVQNGLVLEDVWFDVGNKTFDGVWRGTKTPEAACKEFANACNELLADAKKKLGR